MKKIISILLTASILAGSTAIPLTAVSSDTAATVSQASEASKKASLVVVVYNEDEGGLYTDERTSFMICGNPDQDMGFGMGGSTFLCSVKPSERNPYSLEDINIVPNTVYTVIDTASPDYDGFNYHIDYERSDRTFRFTGEPDQWISIYMKKYYFIDNSDKSVTAATHGQDVFDNMQAVGRKVSDLINSDDFKMLDTADRISEAEELMQSLSDEELIADYSFDEAENVMSFTYKCGNITGQLRPPVFEDEHKQLKQNETTEAKEEVSYRIVRLPDKVEYKVGEWISLNGIQIEVKKGNEEPVVYTYPDVAFAHDSNTPGPATVLLFTDFRSDKAGTYKIEVMDEENVSFEVKVVDNAVTTDTIATTVTVTTTSSTDPVEFDPFQYKYTVTVDIIEVRDNTLLVKPTDGSIGMMTMPTIYLDSEEVPEEGMKLEVTYAGGIVETGLAQFGRVLGVKVVSDNAETVKGDANCDSVMNMSDAVLIMQSLANPAKYGLNGTDDHHITEQGKINGDIAGNNDGITNADALAIQKKLLGLGDTAVDSSVIAGKTFVYEKEGFGSDFDITFDNNGRYSYYEGALSSYIGYGTWEIKDDIVVLTESAPPALVNHFRIEDGSLVYVAEDSDNFCYLKIKDGEKFLFKAFNVQTEEE